MLYLVRMGQQQVLDFLKKYPDKWFTAREIAEGLDLNFKRVSESLKKLRRNSDVNHKKELHKISSSNPKLLGKTHRIYVYQYKE